MKKFIALALALAMMVSCLVFNASAEDSVAVILQGPTTVAKDGTFQVKVRVTDTQNIVGGVQGMVDVTGATVTKVQVNPDLLTWNKTSDENTIYKLDENNDVTFASLNKLTSDSYTTRVWFIIDYKVATDATKVSVTLENVKVSNKKAKAVTTAAAPALTVDVINTEASVTLEDAGIDGTVTKIKANDQAMHVGASVSNIDVDAVTDIGVVFYPTALLNGEELTVETEGAVVANVSKSSDQFEKISQNKGFIGVLEFNFSSEDNALKFLGTLVTARVYYKVGQKVVYASNASESPYISNGTVSKAALNTILDNADKITEPTAFGTIREYQDARKALNTISDTRWASNRAYVLKYCVMNTASK